MSAIIRFYEHKKVIPLSYQVKLGKYHEIPLPDEICDELGLEIGDILICEANADSSSISMKKHADQTLSDEDIALAGNLTRVIALGSEHDVNFD